jgi:hypothetical protein
LEGDVMEKRVTRRFAVLAAAACLFGIVTPTPLVAPTANADQLPNGYNVTCTPMNSDGGANCVVSGCPRVKGDEAGDVVHVRFNAQPQDEIVKGCNDTIGVTPSFINSTVDVASGFTFSVQGCRKHTTSSDDCGAWSIYTYTPPKQAAPAPPQPALPVKCPAGSPVASVPNGQQCPPAPAPAAPVKCPDGSMTDTVPAGQQCAAPTNAVALNITRNGLNARVVVTNNSSLLAKCTYTATKTDGVGPQEVDRSIVVGVKGTTTINDMLWPPLFTSYNAVVKCTATYNGTQTSIGEASQKVSG